MDAAEPLTRARHLQEWLANVAREDDPWRARFFAALPTDMRQTIEATSKVEWLPARMHVVLAEILGEAFGPARAHAYYRRAFAASLRGPVLGPLLRTGIRILGVTPASMIRWAGHGWNSSFRNCGSVSGELLGPAHGRLLYSGLPAVCTTSDAWLDSAQGSAYGALDAMGATGVVRLDKSERGQGRIVLEVEWIEPK
ncbi:MAG TPA: hypothetical protein VGL81_13835 [Polyangiaceae bacterium]|jgi:hypothetical protein